ncbi:MAG: fibronectin type III domain-containing protein, partial [Verrucomicrobia bacterium]|nr:fibronectin type III domain-containing protein [Verrucomicrobiota bacterium]
SVLIPPTVTEIRAYAFYHCEALSSIVIPGSVVRVGSSAFSECYALSRITLEPGVQEIGAFAFNASKPTTVTIPSSVNKIEGSAFCGVGGALTLGLVNFEGRKPPADIDVLAFNGCAVGAVGQYYAGYSAGWSGATILFLPLQSSANPASDFNYTTTGGKVTITGYKGTSTVVMIPPTISGNPVTAITQVSSATAFSLKSIRTLFLPDGLIEIGDSTFKNCTGLTSLSLPESLTKIGASAFEGCAGLTSLKLVKSVTDLGGSSFKNCTGLSSVFFERSTPPTVGSGAFTGTAAGASGYYYAGYSGWSTTSSLGGLTMVARSTAEGDFFSSNVGGFVTITGYRGAGTFVMIPPTIGGVAVTAIGEGAFWEIGPRVTDVLVPDSVTLIGNNAFRSQALLTSIYLPSGLITLGDSAFQGCGALTSIIIPNSVITIGASAFFGTTISASQRGLTSVTLGSSVQTIGEMAFAYNSALGSIRIPASVTTIGANAFNGSAGDVGSLNVFFDGTTPPATIDAAAFSGASVGTVFTGYYPAGAAGWSGVTITGLKLVSMPSGIFGTSFTVYWASVVGATYTIEVSTTPLFVGVDIVKTVNATASETSKLIAGLSANTNYWYRVIATIPAGATTTSSPVPVTTGPADLPIPEAPVLSGLPATMVYQQKVVLAGAVSALQKT